MVSFSRCYWLCIALWVFLFQSSSSAGEPAGELSIQKSANLLPKRLVPNSPRQPSRRLVTQSRQGDRQEFTVPVEEQSTPVEKIEVVEVIADRQVYDEIRGVVTAQGNVLMRFSQSVMTSERLEINLNDRFAVATGNVVLTRGEQVLRGKRFEYNLVADRGTVFGAGGEIYQPSLARDTDFKQEVASVSSSGGLLSDRLINNQPQTDVAATEGLGFNLGSRGIDLVGNNDFAAGSTVNRLRFEADRLDFETENWTAEGLRLTNDPFSPPELELRAETATFQQTIDGGELKTEDSSLVLDDSLKIPLLVSSFAFDRRRGRPGLFNVAFDGDERGGLYIERTWSLLEGENFSWNVSPQYFLQRALIPTTFDFSDADDGGVFNSNVFGLTSSLKGNLGSRTNIDANLSLNSIDLANTDDSLRSKVEVRHQRGNPDNPFQLALEYNYRDRLFNGSLGFQTVRESFGGVVSSPQISLGDTGITINAQGSIKRINDDTDRADLLDEVRENNRISLTRYQAAAFVGKDFSLWRGEARPSKPDRALRYSPVPVVPYLDLLTEVSGVSSIYSNNDSQLSLQGTIGIEGQLGHFSRSWLDYTGFRLSYSQNLRGDESPFLFDRLVDRQTLSVNLTQQIYGPIRLGYQTSIDLRDRDTISTDYIVEYSRRTYNVVLRYNPVLEIGSFSLQVSDFNWQGNSEPFRDRNITPVIQGVD